MLGEPSTAQVPVLEAQALQSVLYTCYCPTVSLHGQGKLPKSHMNMDCDGAKSRSSKNGWKADQSQVKKQCSACICVADQNVQVSTRNSIGGFWPLPHIFDGSCRPCVDFRSHGRWRAQSSRTVQSIADGCSLVAGIKPSRQGFDVLPNASGLRI
jgi:hypothetical protein